MSNNGYLITELNETLKLRLRHFYSALKLSSQLAVLRQL